MPNSVGRPPGWRGVLLDVADETILHQRRRIHLGHMALRTVVT
jgi:hypothetical protein